MHRTIRAAFAALALTAILVTPTLAAKPFVETNEESGTFLIPCGTVTLVETWSQSVVLTTWLDGNGDPTRAHARVRFDGTITAPGSTLRLSDVGRFTSFLDFGPEGMTERQVGVVYKFSAPGLGVVAHDVGQITFFPDGSVETKGPHDVWDNGLEALICPLFE
jgi:hypothetical protein